MNKAFYCADAKATENLASQLARVCKAPVKLYLRGDLGAGKTTFCRGFLKALGFQGKVKSPTYTIVESYQFNHHRLLHFDLYRIEDVEELELMGIRDYFAEQAFIFIEWPEKGEGMLPEADITCYIIPHKQGRNINLTAHNPLGQSIVANL